jgi:hypothetical protein
VRAACFNLRHGIRVTHNRKTLDFVICFECARVNIYEGESELDGVLIAESAQGAVDKVFGDAHIRWARTAPKQ